VRDSPWLMHLSLLNSRTFGQAGKGPRTAFSWWRIRAPAEFADTSAQACHNASMQTQTQLVGPLSKGE
jgi:hypothetical protein